MINRTVLVGRLTKDVELKITPQGVSMARFTVAVNRPFSNGQGEKQADFISCIAWRKQAENLVNFTAKGHLIGVEGRITTGSYDGQDGKKVYTTDLNVDSVQFLEPKGNNNQSNNNQNSSYGNTGGASYNQGQNQSQQQDSYQQPQAQDSYQQPQQNTGANYGNQGGNYQQPQNNPQGQQQNWQQPQQQQNQNYGQPQYNNGGNQPIEVSEDDLPF